jgi:hypothetical protein
MKKLLVIMIGVGATSVVLLIYLAYPFLEDNYQRNMDRIRQDHARQIANVVREFADVTGQLPFQEHAADQPFMVLVSHSPEREDHFANDPVLKRKARWTNSSDLEAVLSNGLKRTVRLPRDPQKVPTFAPNVYIYFVSGNQMTVVSHLKFPADRTVQYDWNGNTFHAFTLCYEMNPSP